MSYTATIRPNVIQEVTIGTQTWALYNYDFGGTWADDDIANLNTLGSLYTWDEAIAIGSSYPGWHLPTLAEVTTLAGYLGGFSVAGGPMKETGTTYWTTPNTGATNSTGFGARASATSLGVNKWEADFWTTEEDSETLAKAMQLKYDNANLGIISIAKTNRFSIRLIKD